MQRKGELQVAANKTIEIPPEGLKLVGITGYIEGNAIWKEFGILRLTAKGQIALYVDRTFCAAGLYNREATSPKSTMYLKPFSQDEIDRKNSFKQTSPIQNKSQQHLPMQRHSGSSGFNDMDDDIPF